MQGPQGGSPRPAEPKTETQMAKRHGVLREGIIIIIIIIYLLNKNMSKNSSGNNEQDRKAQSALTTAPSTPGRRSGGAL